MKSNNERGRQYFAQVHSIICVGAGVCVFVFGALFPSIGNANTPKRIEIRMTESNVNSEGELIELRDIAQILNASRKETEQIGSLDVDSFGKGSKLKISHRQIEARLMLAGYQKSQFDVTGLNSVMVTRFRQGDLQAKVEQLVSRELAEQFGLRIEDVQLRILDANATRSLQETLDPTTLRAEVIFPVKLPLGDKTIRVEFRDESGKAVTSRIPLRIAVMKDVVIATKRIPKGSLISDHDVHPIRRPLLDRSVGLASLEVCVGAIAATDIAEHELLASRHLVASQNAAASGNVVKRNDYVDVVLRKGPMTIRLKNARALGAGAIGERIQVLNVETNKRLTAVVQDKTTVIVR